MRRLLRDPSSLVAGAPFAPIAIVIAHSFVDGFAITGWGVITPEIRDAFGLSLTAVSTLYLATMFLVTVIGLPVSQWCDRTQRKPVVAFGALAAAVFTMLTGLAPVLFVFVVGRVLFDVVMRVNDSAQASMLADYTPLEARPAVYYGRQIVSSFGYLLGPLTFGVLTALFGWRAPVLVVAVPALFLGLATLRLREPHRGAQERAAAGLTGVALETDDESVPFAEAVRMLWAIPTVRFTLWSYLLLGGGLAALGVVAPLFLDEVLGIGPAGRGALIALGGVVGVISMVVGARLTHDYLESDRPERMFRLFAAGGVLAGAVIVLLAAVPNVVVVFLGFLITFVVYGLVWPAYSTICSVVLPARARTVGFAVQVAVGVPGLLVLPLVGAVGDAHGLRWGIVTSVPVFVAGAIIFAFAGRHYKTDVAAVIASSVATAGATAAMPLATIPLAAKEISLKIGQPLLSCRGVDVAYGPVQVLFGVDLEVHEGELVALLGTNGAGKSTLLRAISGTLPVSKGTIVFDGVDITKAGPGKTTGIGLVQVPGGKGVFPSLTVAENLRAASWLHRADTAHVEAGVQRLLERFPVLAERWDTPAGNLSGGEQQMVTLAQALLAKPRMLLIDELSLGLAPTIVAELLDLVRALRDEGITVVLVEQSVNVALSLCDRAVFLEKGEVRFEGPTADLLHRPDVLHSVFLGGAAKGGALTATESSRAAPMGGSVLLEAHDLGKRFGGLTAVHDVSLAVHPGEVLGLLGANGAGKTTVFDLLSGFLEPDAGRIRFRGVDVTAWSADRRARAGLGRSFQDARLFPSLTVAEVIAVALERHLEARDALGAVLYTPAVRHAEAAARERVDELIDLLGLGAFRDKFISELSTGSRRVVDLACALAHEPLVLLLDEPSSGIAQRETEALAPMLLRIRDELGTSLLVIEHDMPLLRAVSDRLICLEAGTPIVEGDPESVLNDPRVVASYLGSDPATIDRSGTAPSNGTRRRRPLVAVGGVR